MAMWGERPSRIRSRSAPRQTAIACARLLAGSRCRDGPAARASSMFRRYRSRCLRLRRTIRSGDLKD